MEINAPKILGVHWNFLNWESIEKTLGTSLLNS